MMATRCICIVGGARYAVPLEATVSRKFDTLAPLGTFWIIGFTDAWRPRRHQERGATFYLLPARAWPVLRYLMLFTVGTALCAWCVFRHGVRIIVAQSPYEAVPAALVKTLARLVGRRVALVVESHGDFESSLFLQRTVRFRGLYARLMAAAARYGARSADLLRAVSDATGRQLRRWAGPRPLVTFHTWTDLDVFFAAAAGRRMGTTVVYAGVLTPLKGIDVLIDALAESGSAGDLCVIGRAIDPAYAAALRRRADERLPGRVQFLGHVGQAELARRLADARVFVLPTYSEGLPRVVLEAMAVGTPVMATAVGGIPEIIDDGLTGWLVPPGDAGAVAARLHWIDEHPAEAEAIGRRGARAAQRGFSIDVYRQGYADVFARAEAMIGPPIRPAVASDRRQG